MDKQSTSIKTKFKSLFCSKSKSQRNEEIQKHKQIVRTVPPKTTATMTTMTIDKPSVLASTISWQHWYWTSLMQTFYTYYSYVYRKCFLLLHEIFKLSLWYSLSPTLISQISLVKAYSTTHTFMAETLENGLVVCLPVNASNSCTKYVNSSKNGLIELNEVLYPALKGFRGSYDYRMIARINPFWLTFEPPSDTLYYIMGTLYIIIFVFGVTGNGLVIYMFARCKALRTASYILVFNMAISDLMIVMKSSIAAYNNFMRGPALGDWGCRLYGFVGGFSGTASISMLTVIALDRYCVVVNPLSSLRLNYNKQYYYFLMLLAWSNALFFSVIPLLEVDLSVYVPEGYLTTCSFDYLDKSMNARIFMFIFFVFAWCIPLFIICYCYIYILKAVFTSKNIQSNRKKQEIEVRLAFIVLLVIGLWFLAWTPYAIIAMMGVFGLEEYLTPTRSMIPALFCKTASCINPFLYTISHKRFRNEMQRLFQKRRTIYRHSMTKSSYITKSNRRTQNRVNLNNSNEYHMELNVCRDNLESKISLDNITIGGVVNSTLYGTRGPYPSVYQHPQKCHRHKKKFKKNISSDVSSEDAGIYVLEIDDVSFENLLQPQPQKLETTF